MQVPNQVLELFSNVLGGGKADPAIVAALRRDHVPEGPYHEYKRGKWFDEHQGKGLRSYVSGFANAEGGVMILGIVGGEDGQGADKWTFEPPTRPIEGWDVWLGKALSDVATKTRIVWDVIDVEGHEVVVIAANRAEELIRVYEKPNLVCYLRVGEHTHPIPETLFADIALGRRAKPDLAIEQLVVTNGGVDMAGFHLNIDLRVHNQGLLWVPNMNVAWSGYALQGTPSSASLQRSLELRPIRRNDARPMVGPVLHRATGYWASGQAPKPVEIRPFEVAEFGARIDGLPSPTDAMLPWAWYGAIVIVPKDGLPLWAQLAVHGAGASTSITKGWQLPRGTVPIVAWFEGADTPPNLEATFGSSAPK